MSASKLFLQGTVLATMAVVYYVYTDHKSMEQKLHSGVSADMKRVQQKLAERGF